MAFFLVSEYCWPLCSSSSSHTAKARPSLLFPLSWAHAGSFPPLIKHRPLGSQSLAQQLRPLPLAVKILTGNKTGLYPKAINQGYWLQDFPWKQRPPICWEKGLESSSKANPTCVMENVVGFPSYQNGPWILNGHPVYKRCSGAKWELDHRYPHLSIHCIHQLPGQLIEPPHFYHLQVVGDKVTLLASLILGFV